MALFPECTPSCARNALDVADGFIDVVQGVGVAIEADKTVICPAVW
jgi:hypothetical protein